MTKKKNKSAAADALIESLMDDLKNIQGESSFKFPPQDSPDEVSPEGFDSFPPVDEASQRVMSESEQKLWGELGLDVKSEPSKLNEDAFPIKMESEVDPINFEEFKIPRVEPVLSSPSKGRKEDNTIALLDQFPSEAHPEPKLDADKTLAAEGFANAKLGHRKSPMQEAKVSVGGSRGSFGASNVLTSVDASLAQAESLKIAQQRITELENEVESLRIENEELSSAGDMIRIRTEELTAKITAIEKEKTELQESYRGEIIILKGNLQFREVEFAKARSKVEEMEARLKSDFKKIRVRERELENRLELLRAEKNAVVRSKDDYILEQKRKIDHLGQELENYRDKCLELNKTIEENQEQVKRTERALRLALTNLESNGENLVPIKKAE
jgi:hypothetical protein